MIRPSIRSISPPARVQRQQVHVVEIPPVRDITAQQRKKPQLEKHLIFSTSTCPSLFSPLSTYVLVPPHPHPIISCFHSFLFSPLSLESNRLSARVLRNISSPSQPTKRKGWVPSTSSSDCRSQQICIRLLSTNRHFPTTFVCKYPSSFVKRLLLFLY